MNSRNTQQRLEHRKLNDSICSVSSSKHETGAHTGGSPVFDRWRRSGLTVDTGLYS